MKLLHTADLHLGKSLHESSLLDDQRIMLAQLHDELAKDNYAALIVSGDIYDRTVPPAEAVELFSGFLVSLRQDFPELEIFIIPGNHDSAQRLSYADRILGTQHIHIVSSPEKSFIPIITAKNEEKLAIFLLPFLGAGTLKVSEKTEQLAIVSPEFDFSVSEPSILLTQADLAAEASRRFSAVLANPELKGIPSVLIAHLFTQKGVSSDSERIFLGMAEQVNPSLFSRFSYVALGHLHRAQKLSERMYYSGSPLAYAFDEAGVPKHFLKVEIDCVAPGFPVTVTPIPVEPFRKVTRLSASFADFYTGTAYDAHAADYLEVTLTDSELIANPMNLLRTKFPYLLSLKQGIGQAGTGLADNYDTKPGGSLNPGELLNPQDDFRRFEEMLHGEAEADRVELFRELLKECSDEA